MNNQIKLWHALLLTLVVSVLAAWGAYNDGENKSLQERLKQGSIEVGFNRSEAKLPPPSKPNLYGNPFPMTIWDDAKNIRIYGTVKVGTPVSFVGYVSNNGSVPTGGGYSYRFCLDSGSKDNCYASGTGQIMSWATYWSRSPGTYDSFSSSADSSQPTGRWTATKGSHTAYICADTDKDLFETVETAADNCNQISFTVL